MSPGRRGPRQATLFEIELDDAPGAEPAESPPPAAAPAPRPAAGGTPAAPPFRVRVFAGLVDLGIHVAIAALALFGTRLLGVPPGLSELPAFAVLLVVFSLFYTVVPLAFWG
jgi:hypothetical protein